MPSLSLWIPIVPISPLPSSVLCHYHGHRWILGHCYSCGLTVSPSWPQRKQDAEMGECCFIYTPWSDFDPIYTVSPRHSPDMFHLLSILRANIHLVVICTVCLSLIHKVVVIRWNKESKKAASVTCHSWNATCITWLLMWVSSRFMCECKMRMRRCQMCPGTDCDVHTPKLGLVK